MSAGGNGVMSMEIKRQLGAWTRLALVPQILPGLKAKGK